MFALGRVTWLGLTVLIVLDEDCANGCEAVLFPLPFDVNQDSLPLAEHQVLKSGERQELIFGIHDAIRSARRGHLREAQSHLPVRLENSR
jgi:hypothetical protein